MRNKLDKTKEDELRARIVKVRGRGFLKELSESTGLNYAHLSTIIKGKTRRMTPATYAPILEFVEKKEKEKESIAIAK